VYNPAGKSDPFQPFMEVDLAVKREKERKAKEEELRRAAQGKRPISPLQQAEISQFRLVGIAGSDKQRMAVVEDNTAKKIYPVYVGTPIGPHGGRVASILEDRLIVEEPVLGEPDKPQKKKQARQIPIMLRKGEEGKP
jgi:Tfp pilus assembly protein PilP